MRVLISKLPVFITLPSKIIDLMVSDDIHIIILYIIVQVYMDNVFFYDLTE